MRIFRETVNSSVPHGKRLILLESRWQCDLWDSVSCSSDRSVKFLTSVHLCHRNWRRQHVLECFKSPLTKPQHVMSSRRSLGLFFDVGESGTCRTTIHLPYSWGKPSSEEEIFYHAILLSLYEALKLKCGVCDDVIPPITLKDQNIWGAQLNLFWLPKYHVLGGDSA